MFACQEPAAFRRGGWWPQTVLAGHSRGCAALLRDFSICSLQILRVNREENIRRGFCLPCGACQNDQMQVHKGLAPQAASLRLMVLGCLWKGCPCLQYDRSARPCAASLLADMVLSSLWPPHKQTGAWEPCSRCYPYVELLKTSVHFRQPPYRSFQGWIQQHDPGSGTGTSGPGVSARGTGAACGRVVS